MASPRVRRHLCAGAAPALLASWALAGCAESAPQPCDIAVAASLRPFALDLARELAAAVPPLSLRLSAGATGSLVEQIRRGAPFALLLAADAETTDVLVGDGRLPVADRFAWARGSLVLWTRHDLGTALQRDGLGALRDVPIERLAIANPEVAPYGRAALIALRRAGVLDALQPHLVRAENAAQAAHFAHSGAVDFALLPAALAAGLAGHCWPLPMELHEPIVHTGAVLAPAGEQRAAALRVRALLQSPAGAALIAAHGLLPLE